MAALKKVSSLPWRWTVASGDYTPAAQLYDGLKWQDITPDAPRTERTSAHPRIVDDLYQSASDVLAAIDKTVTSHESLTRQSTDPLGQLTLSSKYLQHSTPEPA